MHRRAVNKQHYHQTKPDTQDLMWQIFPDQAYPDDRHGNACNITLGLPIIRTSVDHGTALDLAGSGGADSGSLYNAIDTAIEMVEHSSTP